MLAVDNEIFRGRRIGPDVGVMDDKRGQGPAEQHDEPEALGDERSLKVRIGQFSGDGGALVFHDDSLPVNGANENRAAKLFDRSPWLFVIGSPGRLFCVRHLFQRFLAPIDESLQA